eukprot:403372605
MLMNDDSIKQQQDQDWQRSDRLLSMEIDDSQNIEELHDEKNITDQLQNQTQIIDCKPKFDSHDQQPLNLNNPESANKNQLKVQSEPAITEKTSIQQNNDVNISQQQVLQPQPTYLMSKQILQEKAKEQIEQELMQELQLIQEEVERNFDQNKAQFSFELGFVANQNLNMKSKGTQDYNFNSGQTFAPGSGDMEDDIRLKMSSNKFKESNRQSRILHNNQGSLDILENLIQDGLKTLNEQKSQFQKLNFDDLTSERSFNTENSQAKTPNKSLGRNRIEYELNQKKQLHSQSKRVTPTRKFTIDDDRKIYQRKHDTFKNQTIDLPLTPVAKSSIQLNIFSMNQRENIMNHSDRMYSPSKGQQISSHQQLFYSSDSKLTLELLNLAFIIDNKSLFTMHSSLISDYELAKSDQIFTQVLQSQPKCHEALFGMGKNSFYKNDYEKAQEYFKKAIRYKRNNDQMDLGYFSWFSFSLMMSCIQKQRVLEFINQKCTGQKERLQLLEERNKLIQDACKYISRCIEIDNKKRQQRQSDFIIPCFIMLKILIIIKKFDIKLSPSYQKIIREPEYYANIIKTAEYDKTKENFYGYLAWSLLYLNLKPDKFELGIEALDELISLNPTRPEAYIILWSYCNQQICIKSQQMPPGNVSEQNQKQIYNIQQQQQNEKWLEKQVEVSERMFIFATDFKSYHEKLLISLLYSKTLYMTQSYQKLFTLLQLEYSKAPHYTSLLYQYGKYVIKSQEIEFYGSGLGALEECLRIIQFYMGMGNLNLDCKFKAFQMFEDSLIFEKPQKCKNMPHNTYNSIVSLSKHQLIDEFKKKIDVSLFQKLSKLYKSISLKRDKIDEQQLKQLKDQNLFYLYQKFVDYDEYQANLFKAIFQYKVFENMSDADLIFQKLVITYPYKLDALVEYLEFLNVVKNYKAGSQIADLIINLLDKDTRISTDEWINAHLSIARLYKKSNRLEDAIEILNQLRGILPPIDLVQISDFKLPFDIQQYSLHPLNHKNQFPSGDYQEKGLDFNEGNQHCQQDQEDDDITDTQFEDNQYQQNQRLNNKEKMLYTIDEKDEDISRSQILFKDSNLKSTALLVNRKTQQDNQDRYQQNLANKNIYQSVLSLDKNQDIESQQIDNLFNQQPQVIITEVDEDQNDQFLFNHLRNAQINQLEPSLEKSSSLFQIRKLRESVTDLNQNLRRSYVHNNLSRNDQKIMYFDNTHLINQTSNNYEQFQDPNLSSQSIQGRVSIRSSIPKIARLSTHNFQSDVLNNKNKQQNQNPNFPKEIQSQQINQKKLDQENSINDSSQDFNQNNDEDLRDENFSVSSNFHFLNKLAKICMKSVNLLYADQALWSIYDYLLLLAYYKDFYDNNQYLTLKLKASLCLAEILLLSDEYENAEKVIQEIYDQCLDRGGAIFDKMQSLYCQVIANKGFNRSINLQIDYFYSDSQQIFEEVKLNQ